MKLVIQIPCLNEEQTLPATLADLPRELPGIDEIEWLVIDDGSTDATRAVAREHGVDHIVALPYHQGLARAFMAGLEASLARGADIIVNTDADNQYDARCIPDLVQPILDKTAHIVIGERPIASIKHFSLTKKILQRIGSYVVRLASGRSIPDAPSGFRAFHPDAARQLYVFSAYTYTLETIIQAGRKNIPMVSVPVSVNKATRPSRLMSSIPSYLRRSIGTIFRIFVIYRPMRFFSLLAAVVAFPGIAALIRFLYYFFSGAGDGHVQSLVISAALLASAVVLFMGGLLAELVAANRVLLEEIRSRELSKSVDRADEA